MSATLFDLHAAEVCPEELAALEATRATYLALVQRFLDGAPEVNEADCLAAKDLADRAAAHAEAVFRALWPQVAARHSLAIPLPGARASQPRP
ncbi:hypothetical protein LMG19083_04842 [Ralstonia psammae]|uniref:Uncharacterized protein n=1 Tax=Ralstonia psammae TaxID=3058598 RepID=A0ABN9JI74_9RALS|nr:hypothetical protein [Ralstonia sp. LMG 19083]CAJ0809096.1 hypothetical protein LMG19083_04842 [Ralstonia sp. LMG 19083]